jgi:hypothetical protein
VDGSDSVADLFSAALNLRILLPRFSLSALNLKKEETLGKLGIERKIVVKLIGKEME